MPDLKTQRPPRAQATAEAVDPALPERQRRSRPSSVGNLRTHSTPPKAPDERRKSGIVAKRKRRSTKGFDAED